MVLSKHKAKMPNLQLFYTLHTALYQHQMVIARPALAGAGVL